MQLTNVKDTTQKNKTFTKNSERKNSSHKAWGSIGKPLGFPKVFLHAANHIVTDAPPSNVQQQINRVCNYLPHLMSEADLTRTASSIFLQTSLTKFNMIPACESTEIIFSFSSSNFFYIYVLRRYMSLRGYNSSRRCVFLFINTITVFHC